METLSHEFVHVVQATPDEVWAALTVPEKVKRYYFRFDLFGEIRPGEEYRLVNEGHGPQIEGETLEVDRPRRLVQTFRFTNGDDPATRLTWTLEPWGREGTVLSLVHDDFHEETDTYRGVAGGWPAILSGLKTYLETGKELRYVPEEE